MSKVFHTKRYTVRLQHLLAQDPYPEVRHGHACDIEVSLTRPFGRAEHEAVQKAVVERLDGKILNEFLPNATGECLVEWIFTELNATILAECLGGVCLQETRKNRFISSRNDLLLR